MNLTEILTAEHLVIKQVLRCLKRMADKCRSQGRLDVQQAREAIEFFRHHADDLANYFGVPKVEPSAG